MIEIMIIIRCMLNKAVSYRLDWNTVFILDNMAHSAS